MKTFDVALMQSINLSFVAYGSLVSYHLVFKLCDQSVLRAYLLDAIEELEDQIEVNNCHLIAEISHDKSIS